MRTVRTTCSRTVFGAAIVLSVLVPLESEGQSMLRGRVIDEDSGLPIDGARVTLVTLQLRQVKEVLTDSSGLFIVPSLEPRRIRLRARRVGYQPALTPPLALHTNEILDVEIRLARNAVLLAPVAIVGRTPQISPILEQFEYRRQRGFGVFLTREDVERRNAFYVTDILTMVPGVRLGSGTGRAGGRNVFMTRSPALRSCPAQLYVDGFLINRPMSAFAGVVDSARAADMPTSQLEFSLDDVVSPAAIEGIEIYRGLSEVPAEFLGPNSHCGVVAVWTRRGGQPRRR